MIKEPPDVGPETTRSFIRFVVVHIPRDHPYNPHRGEWWFRADMMARGLQFNVDWYQPDQEAEPAPDPKVFYRAIASLLRNAESGGPTPA